MGKNLAARLVHRTIVRLCRRRQTQIVNRAVCERLSSCDLCAALGEFAPGR